MTVQKNAIDWDDLRVFLALLRARSLRGAARALGLNHATVGRRLRGLEAALGSRLFERTPEGLLPTPAGEALLARAERVEDELARAEREIAGRDAAPGGVLKVSLPFAVVRGFLAADLAAFARGHPGIELDLELTDSFADLARLQADVSIRMAHEVGDDVVGRRLVRYAKTLYAAPDVAAPGGEAARTWIGWHGGDGDSDWVRGTPYPATPVRHNAPRHALQLELARAGLGIAMLPCFLGDGEAGLVRMPGALPLPDRSLWLLLRADLRRTARARAFVDFIAAAILDRRDLLEGRGTGKAP